MVGGEDPPVAPDQEARADDLDGIRPGGPLLVLVPLGLALLAQALELPAELALERLQLVVAGEAIAGPAALLDGDAHHRRDHPLDHHLLGGLGRSAERLEG
jgi:hypothetical protein